MNKIDGLKLLARYFPQNVIDSSFIQGSDELPALFAQYGEAGANSYWRIRCANPGGSEFGLPMGSFYSNADARQFVQTIAARHPEYSFIFHRIDDLYYYPNYCGTIEICSSDRFELAIELQHVTKEMIDSMDSGTRPRDWPTCVCLRQNASQLRPVLAYGDVCNLENPLRILYKIAIKLCWIYTSCGFRTISYTRFNICQDGSIVLNDHRGGSSFVDAARPPENTASLLSLNTDDVSFEQMYSDLQKQYLISRTTALNALNHNTFSLPPETKGTLLQGLGVSWGTAAGRALVLLDNDSFENGFGDKIQDNTVLVCKTMTPELVVLCQKISGIVTDQGGISSHAAILGRELGIPCVTSIVTGTKMIKNGNLIQINGSTGEVYYEPSTSL